MSHPSARYDSLGNLHLYSPSSIQRRLVTLLISVCELMLVFLRSLLAPVDIEVINLTETPEATPDPVPHYGRPPRAPYPTLPRQLPDPAFFYKPLAVTHEEEGEAEHSEEEDPD